MVQQLTIQISALTHSANDPNILMGWTNILLIHLYVNSYINAWIYVCGMYVCNGESIDHLLIHCPIATELLTMVFSLFGIHCFILKTVVDLLACWQGKFGWHQNCVIWMAVPHYLMWCIWLFLIPDLKLFFFKTLLDWLSVIGSHSIFSVFSLMDVCNLCFWLFLSLVYTSYILGWHLFWYSNKIFSLLIKKKCMVYGLLYVCVYTCICKSSSGYWALRSKFEFRLPIFGLYGERIFTEQTLSP